MITKLHYHRSLPNVLVCEDAHGNLTHQNTLELKPINEDALRPIFAHRTALMPVPAYIYRFYGVQV